MNLTTIEKLVHNAKKIGCVGTSTWSDLPEERYKLCILIGMYLVHLDKEVHSGNAEGCDGLYAAGANSVNPSLVYLYLVNEKHNPHQIVLGNHLIYDKDHPEWAPKAMSYHGGYHQMSKYVQQLFNRNAGICSNIDLLIAMPNRNKKWGGGTGHDIRISQGRNIPIINLNEEETCKEFLALISQSGLIKLNGERNCN